MAEREDKRIRRTKKLLRESLTCLLEQKDVQNITVTELVREADINRGTFYAHYRDVYDLREKIEQEMIDDFRQMIEGFRPNEGNTSLRPLLQRAVAYLEENRRMVCALVRVSGPNGLPSRLVAILEECRQEIAPYRQEEDAYISRFMASGVVGVLYFWLISSNPLPAATLVDLMTQLLAPIMERV